ncbi:MAG: glycosyltransferase [Nocardioides sp.]|nr:glycosyltransferase [Nocardioides sp.]
MTGPQPLVEFVIPFYGAPDYLHQAVGSLRDQGVPDWRATILDDCYPYPGLDDWVTSLHDPRIRVLHNATTLGVNANFSRALSVATAEYVVILGCDDRLLPTYVETVHRLVETTRAQVIQPGVRIIDRAGDARLPLVDRVKRSSRPRGRAVLRGEDPVASLLRGNWCYFPSLCWHRETAARIGFRADYQVVQDLALLVDVLLAGGTLVVDDEVCFEYRRHAASLSSVQAVSGGRFEEERAYFADITRRAQDVGWSRAARAGRARVMSRAHALTMLPTAVRTADVGAVTRLARHAFAS